MDSIISDMMDFFRFDPSLLSGPEMMLRLGFQVVLLSCSAFFAGSETALFSLSRMDLQQLYRQRHPRSDILHNLLSEPRRLIISILCGNELTNIAATANMTGILITLYGVEQAGWMNLLVMVPLLLLFGEVTPKTLAVSHPVAASTRFVAAPMNLWVRAVLPLRWIIRSIADRITTWIVGEHRDAEHLLRISEFRTLLEEIEQEEILSAVDRILIYNLLDAGSTEISEIMTPRHQIDFIALDERIETMIETFIAHRHLRSPVYRNNRDDIVGFLHAEDIIRLLLDREDLEKVSALDLIHEAVLVPETKSVEDMLEYFQSEGRRSALVLDEFGSVSGIVTMEDMLNFIFSEIAGEFPPKEAFQEEKAPLYQVPGGMKLDDFNDLTHFGIQDPKMTSIGGVVFRHLDRFPRVGDVTQIGDLRAEVLEMDGLRIARVRIGKSEIFPKEEPDGKGEGT